MDRRGFFKLFGAGVAGITLEQAIPLGRVWSFPSKIVVPWPKVVAVDLAYYRDYTVVWVTPETLEKLRRQCLMKPRWDAEEIVKRGRFTRVDLQRDHLLPS